MGEDSKIEWCHHTFNPWIGCTKVSDGCTHCYAEVETFPRVQRGRGLELWGANAARHVTGNANWRKPLAWARAAAEVGERHRVFCASLADVMEDRVDLIAPRERLWQLIYDTPELDWLLLTKRPENIASLTAPLCAERGWPSNAWMGATTENRVQAHTRAAHLKTIPAPVRFLSVEPMLGPIDDLPLDGISWAIFGGESGDHARPCAVEWIERGIDQCRAANVPPFVKQLGANCVSEQRVFGAEDMAFQVGRPLTKWEKTPDGTEAWAWRANFKGDPKGGHIENIPEDLRLRLFPGDEIPPLPVAHDCGSDDCICPF